MGPGGTIKATGTTIEHLNTPHGTRHLPRGDDPTVCFYTHTKTHARRWTWQPLKGCITQWALAPKPKSTHRRKRQCIHVYYCVSDKACLREICLFQIFANQMHTRTNKSHTYLDSLGYLSRQFLLPLQRRAFEYVFDLLMHYVFLYSNWNPFFVAHINFQMDS